MNNKIKGIGTGLSITGINIIAANNIIPGIGTCTGTCGACGLSCLVPIVSVSSICLAAILKKKIKYNKLFRHMKINNKSKMRRIF